MGKQKSSTNGTGLSGYIHCKAMNLNPYLKPYTKINSTWIRDLNVKAKTIYFRKKNG